MKKFLTITFILLLSNCSKSEGIVDIKKVPIVEDWYKTTTLLPDTHIIEEPKSSQGNVSYLIVGDSKALMMDTGSGENLGFQGTKIKYLINGLTDIPISLLLSHFHFDHNQNIHEFNNISFPDIPSLKQKIVNSIYPFSSEELFSGNYPESATVTEWLPIKTDIDLGNRIIQLVNIKGHTNESVAIIDKTNKFAFLGDYLYNGTLFLFNENDVVSYKTSIDYLISIFDPSYRLFGAHGTPEISFSKLKELQDFLICIQNNSCSPTSQFVWGKDTHLYEYKTMKIRIFL
jgi:glyoxylase-like metal-dependent hydrolase (beta-lactamase superfamily II)